MTKINNSLFSPKARENAEELKALNDLMRRTADRIDIHNRIVKSIWKAKHKIAQHEARIKPLDEDTVKKLRENIEKWEAAFAETHSSEIIQKNLNRIEHEAHRLFPEEKFNLDSPSFDLRRNFK